MSNNIAQRLSDIEAAMSVTTNDLPLSLKIRTADLILKMMASSRKDFGLFVILGWRRKWADYLDLPDSEQDIFADNHLNILHLEERSDLQDDVRSTLDFDGAILIDARGNVIHSGVLIGGMRPKVVARHVNPGRFRDLSEQFGFSEKVHTRHLTAISSSYIFNGTTVFTVSEESGSFHIYEKGRIVYQG